MRLATNSQKLERWLGAQETEQLSASMKDWYGPPIAVGNVPGKVYACKGGDFRGRIEAGSEASIWDKAMDSVKRIQARADYSFERWMRKQRMNPSLNGFSSLSDLISEASGDKGRIFYFHKIGVTGVVSSTMSLWRPGDQPIGGGAAAGVAAGTAYDSTTTGAFPFTNPTGGDTQHFVSGFIVGSVAGNQLLLYDRIFGVTKAMSSSGTENVTGVPTRYQGISGGATGADGNFVFIETRSILSNTAHNWTVCKYTDQAGNTGHSFPSVTGNAICIQDRLDMPINNWFIPLATGDTGVKAISQLQCSSASLTGAIDFVIGHPIAWFPCPIANMLTPVDGIQSAFQLERIIDSACMAFLEVSKPTTTAATYSGLFKTVAG